MTTGIPGTHTHLFCFFATSHPFPRHACILFSVTLQITRRGSLAKLSVADLRGNARHLLHEGMLCSSAIGMLCSSAWPMRDSMGGGGPSSVPSHRASSRTKSPSALICSVAPRALSDDWSSGKPYWSTAFAAYVHSDTPGGHGY